MIPDEWPSMRSMARCVFPVLVGPSPAVTPAPRAPKSRLVAEEKEIGIKWQNFWPELTWTSVPQCDGRSAVASLCLICGTSLERIKPESLTRPLSEFVHGYISLQERAGALGLVKSSREGIVQVLKPVNIVSQANPS